MKTKQKRCSVENIKKKGCKRTPIILGLSLALLMPFSVYASRTHNETSLNQSVNQSRTVNGFILDEAGAPMIGVSVLLKGSSTGTVTDLDGKFVLSVPQGASLEISYLGYKSQLIVVGNKTDFKIQLVPDTQDLDEVVVIGYGTVKKRDLTGSVSSVKASDLVKIPASNAMEALQGQVPGLDITRNSGSATSGVSINIRGNRSLVKDAKGKFIGNDPLFIIDGMQGGNFADISPSDIESIEVLKDASSTAIYGSQGANGVIIITTKKGKAGTSKVSYNGYYGVNGWAQYPEMRTGAEYTQLRREAYRTAGQWESANDDQKIFLPEEWEAVQNGDWTDWVGEVVKNGSIQSHQVTVSGGTEKTNALFSAGYYQEKGAFKNDEMNRYNLRINVDHKLNRYITLGVSSQLTHYAQDDRADNVLWRAATNAPLGKAYDENGDVILFPLGKTARVSPLADEADEYTAKHHNLMTNMIANGYFEFKPIKGLVFRSNLGTNLKFRKQSDYAGANSIDRAGEKNTSESGVSNSNSSFVNWDNVISYTKDIKNHTFGITGLTSWTQSKYNMVNASGEGQLISKQLYHNLGANEKDSYVIGSDYIQSQTFSYALRANYSYMGRYLLTVSNRWDGSSRLASGHKWSAFPSVALAWRVSDENWLKDVECIDNLKMRLSWGKTGNSVISEYGTQSGLAANSNAAFQNNSYTYYTYNTFLGNQELGWETSATWNLGFDLGFLNNRINATIDLYETKTTDMLLPRLLPTSAGSGNNTPFQMYQNIGSSKNKGIELTINTVNIRKKDFTWNTTLTFSANKEKITSLVDGQDIIGATPETETLLIGRPLKSFYTFKRLGIWQTNEADVAATYFKDKAKTQAFQPGDIKVEDLNGDHVIDQKDDVAYIGSASPKWIGGFSNTFSYKNFDLNVYFVARWGQLIASDFTAAYTPDGTANAPAYLDYWTPENPSNDFPRPNLTKFYNYTGYQSLNYVDGSYLKLKTISLGYTLPKSFLNKVHAQNLRVYVTANNLFSWSKSHLLKDYDPERGGSAKSPLQRQLLVGVNLEF